MKELCAECDKKKKHKAEPLAVFLLTKLNMQENGCPLDRHELLNHEWRLLSVIKDERRKAAEEDAEEEEKKESRRRP